jgi:hypothetical protein
MNISMDFMNINWLTVMAATVVGFLIAGCWYSPLLFGRFLPRLMTDVESRTGASRNIGGIFFVSFAMLWLSASFLAGLMGPLASAREGFDVGLGIGLCFVFPAHTIAAIFGDRPVQVVFITGGYFTVCFAVMGAILGAWH